MELLERITDIKISDKNKFLLEETNDKYYKYLEEISQFDSELLNNYLYTIKHSEILNNQQTEDENSFLISLYNSMNKENSLDKIIKLLKDKNELTKEDLQSLHKTLMTGTYSEELAYNFRSDNNKFVGAINNDGTKRIDYIPIDYKKIPNSIDKALEFLNNNNIDNVFINPFIFHGALAVMQPFDDGNTRLSRLVQHAKIWKNTNHIYGKNFKKPIIYLSKNYLMTRKQYRDLIANLAINSNDEAWNKWFTYNMYMVDEQLNYLNNSVELVKKHF
ncbi:MAG: Fic family protein [Firmicutes bacterium]|nr:Fic family protein [Bacillota bacterium]